MAANTFSFPANLLRYSQSFDAKRSSAPSFLPSSSMFGNKLLIRPQLNSSRFVTKYHRSSATATVSFSLPTTVKPETASPDKIPKWSARAIRSFAMAELEARKLKYPNTGTEAFLMGILVEGTSTTAKFLRANGITLFKVREETLNLLGKSDLFFFSPERPPLTEQAQRALDWAFNEKLKSVFSVILIFSKFFESKSPSASGEKVRVGK
ncbi:hypothetical protein CISIN_1g026790mg [Citrus sinensis]|uniref:Clp R domain-containing protein n=1 Tax=Citrus sinensis TaxID=2711 RepID=A0A067FDG4_CITSI|nr:hypothetical protein CISIN_1g026790mg [Citrus sinensis]KDO65384.1 hypothetical protein CISIN_1g026790mg [Citrus sinensis]